MKPLLWIAFFLTITLAVITTYAQQNKGTEHVSLYGGSWGAVPFPHHVHQRAVKACETCHDVFPQESGSIEALKVSGALEKKQVMDQQCRQCHREMKNKGLATGPTRCRTCHIKEEG